NVPAHHHDWQGQQSRRSHEDRQQCELRTHSRFLWLAQGNGLVLRQDRSGRHICQSSARRDDRRVAGLPAVRWMEGFRRERQERRRLLLCSTLHARTKPHVDQTRRERQARGEESNGKESRDSVPEGEEGGSDIVPEREEINQKSRFEEEICTSQIRFNTPLPRTRGRGFS